MMFSYETSDITSYHLLREFAKKNRENATLAEQQLWLYLKREQLGAPFRRQHIIGVFIADFVCLHAKLVIEVDGKYHSLPEQQISDEEITNWLNRNGYRVLRFSNEEVLFDIDKVLPEIRKGIKL